MCMLDGPLEVIKLVLPARFPVRAVGAFVLVVLSGSPVPTQVIREDGHSASREENMRIRVSTDVFGASMLKDEYSFRCVGRIGARVDSGG